MAETARWYIGCATDPKYVDLTAAMLSSIDDCGEAPEAVVLLADFGLEPSHRETLRASAGALGRRMRFIPISADSPKIVALPTYSFPLPLIGRMILPREIRAPGARLLLIDSDAFVNASLRPLFETDLQGHPVAAVHNPLVEAELIARGRRWDPDFFNAGVMLLDVDAFNARDLGAVAMRRLASYDPPPEWLDNDALCEVIGGDWRRLDRRWNFFYAGEERPFGPQDYEAAFIVHFAGSKPWDSDHHPALPIYRRNVERAHAKLRARAAPAPVTALARLARVLDRVPGVRRLAHRAYLSYDARRAGVQA